MIKIGVVGAGIIADSHLKEYFTLERPKWFLDKKMSGGGIFINLGAHSIDKLMWITGVGIKRIIGKTGDFSKYDVDGNAQAFIELENGVTATINICGYKTPHVNETIFYFTEGTIKLCTGRGLWISKGSAYEEVILPSVRYMPFEHQLKNFVDSIINDSTPPITGEYGRKVINAIEMVYKYNTNY